ncbi:hypothetical protein NDU88_002901 [Pleurodeles waltl]|uniref:Uncharacterized protein n=1 Tax=Pleurodeles waltl TaxID=8319 RepID=A0AAV7T471_PLEWA|nr:hypothetical protein NDU88_002901 [Pleurodeles waltl]
MTLLRLAPVDAQAIDLAPTMKELRAAIRGLDRAKVPGSDGFLAKLYQMYSTALGEKLLQVFMEANALGVLLPTIREGVINLLPKPGGDLEDPFSCRPNYYHEY